MKKMLVLLLASSMLLSVASCGASDTTDDASGSSSSSSSSSDEGSDDVEKTQIYIHCWTADENMEDAVAVYNEMYPDREAIYVKFPDSEDSMHVQVNTMLASDTQMDVLAAMMDEAQLSRILSGAIEPLDEYLAADGLDYIELQGEDSAALENIDGSYYGLTYDTCMNGFYYNKELLAELGIEEPTSDWTWDDFEDICAQISGSYTEDGEEIYGYVSYYIDSWAHEAAQLIGSDSIYSDDYTASNFDDPAFATSLQRIVDLQNGGGAIPYSSFPSQQLDNNLNQAALFFDGQVAFIQSGTFFTMWSTQEQFEHEFEMGVVSTPKTSEDAEITNVFWNADWCIPAKSEYKEEAWDLIRLMVIEQPDLINCKRGKTPAYVANTDDEELIQSSIDYMLDGVNIDRSQMETVFFTSVNTVSINQTTVSTAKAEITDIMGEEVEKALLGEISVEEALANMKERSDALISAELS